MNVLFITMADLRTIERRGIYEDLLRKFRDSGHRVSIITPRERRTGIKTSLVSKDGINILGVKTLNLQKTNIIEKGVGQILVERQFKSAYRRYLGDESYDLILYSTPPIMFGRVIECVKKRNKQAIGYLLLKDIFPQNAVDLGMMSKTGLKGLLYKFFRKKEKRLYAVSDYIGCMSPANVDYVLDHNPELESGRVEVAPNSIEVADSVDNSPERSADAQNERQLICKKYDLPTDRKVFIYGGNLGKPQGIEFIIKCLDENKTRKDCYFIVVGTGTDYDRLASWYSSNKGGSVKVMKGLPKEDYDKLVRMCDVGLIFLDHRFTIPNFPSRLLSYMEYRIPVICATDVNTDLGRIAEENGFGYWCESVKPEDFTSLVNRMLVSDIKRMGERGYEYLKENYVVDNTYNTIMKHCKETN